MARPQTFTVTGNTKISNLQSKFGGTSIAFDGTGDKLTVASTSDFAFGTGDFTAECFIRRAATTTNAIFDFRSASVSGNPILLFTSNTLQYSIGGAIRISTGVSGTLNTWRHVAVVRYNGTTTLYVNGSAVGTPWTTNNNIATSTLTIGSYYNNTAYFNGYIDEVRVSNVARYTGNFTAPTVAFTDDANTVLLVHADGANNSTTFTDDDSYSPYDQTNDDLLYIEDDYFTPDGYYVYTANVESAISSQATMTTAIGVIKNAQSAITVTASITATISHIEGADLFAFSEALLAAEVSRIRDNNADLSTQFSSAIDASRIRHISADDMAVSTIFVGNNIRVRFNEAAVNAAFSLAADVELVPGGEVLQGEAALSVSATVECHAQRKRNIIDCDVNVEFTQSAAAQRLAGLASTQDVTVFQSTTADRLRGVDSAVTSTASISVDVNEIVQLASSLTATANISCVISHIEGADLTAFTNAVLSAQADRTRDLTSAITSTASVSASVNEIQSIGASLSCQFSQSTSADKLKDADAALSATATLTPIYLSYKNRHNHSAYFTGGGASLSTANVKYGSGSLRAGNTTAGSSLQIQTLQSQTINANQDFYISIWIDMSSTTASVVNTFYPYVVAGNWEIGYRTNASNQNFASIRYNGSSLLTQTATTAGQPAGWSQYEFYRTGSTLSFKFTRANGSPVTVSTTYSGAISTGALDYIWFDAPGRVSVDTYFDEFYMAKDISAPVNYKPSGEIFDGALSTTEFLFHFNGDLYDELAGPTEASASLTAQALVSALARTTASAVSNQTAAAALSASADASIRQVSANLQANGFIIAAAGRIQPETAALDSNFVLSASVDKIENAQAAFTSTFTLSAQGFDLDLASAALTSQFALTAQGDRYKLVNAGLTSTGSVYARATKTLATWSSDSWYRGYQNISAEQFVVFDSQIIEAGNYTSGGFDAGVCINSRDISRGTPLWSINLPYNISNTYVQALDPVIREYLGLLYINVGYQNTSFSPDRWYNTMIVLDPETQTIISSWSTNFARSIEDFVIDTTGIYYSGLGGDVNSDTTLDAVIAKTDLTGSVQWKKFADSTLTASGRTRLFLVNDKLYWYFTLVNIANDDVASIAIVNKTTGSATHRLLGLDGSGDLHIDTNENIYIVGSTDKPLSSYGIITKVNNSGTTQWTKGTITTVSDGLIEVDSDGNVYLAEQMTDNLNQYWTVYKLSSAGSLIWAKRFTDSNQVGADIHALKAYDDRLLIIGRSDNETITINVAAVDGDKEHINVPFPTAYHNSGTWSWTNYTPNWTNKSYTIGSSTGLALADVTFNNYTFSPTVTSATPTAFTYLYTVEGIGSWTSTASQSIAYTRIRPGAAQLTTTIAQSTTGLKLAQLNAAISVSTSVSAVSIRIRPGASALQTSASLSITGKKFTGYAAAGTAETTAIITAQRFRNVDSSSSSEFTQETDNNRLRDNSAAFTAFYSEVTAAFKNATGTILMESTTTLTCDARKITDSPQYMFVNANLTAQGTSTLFGLADLTTTSAFNLVPTYLRRNEAYLTSSTSLALPVIGRIRPGASSQGVQAFLQPYTENSKITGYASTLLSASALVVNNQILRLAQADLASEFTTPYIYAGVLVRIEANLQVTAFTLTAGRVINIDSYYQLLIVNETRTLEVHRENRVISINSETRVNKIKGYPAP